MLEKEFWIWYDRNNINVVIRYTHSGCPKGYNFGELSDTMNKEQIVKKFPSYFENFEMPKWAREQELQVYRACATGKVDRESFLNSFEENEYKISVDGDVHDPQEYSLSTYIKLRDVKRFMTMDSRFGVPFVIAKGTTKPIHGICLETKEWKRNLGIKYKGSHVDWWLYTDAEPYKEFEVLENES